MRKDFSKVVTERPRSNGRWGKDYQGIPGKRLKEIQIDEDLHFKREPMSMSRGTKQFTDVLGPLRRYLKKQVGRSWNKIYSDFCRNFNRNSNTQNHLIRHALDYVAFNVQYIKEGKDKVPYTSEGYRISSFKNEYFYVCPETGILKIAPKIKSKPKTVRNDFKEIDGKYYKEKDNIWYEIVLGKIKRSNTWYGVPIICKDVLYKKNADEINDYRYTRKHGFPYVMPNVYCVKKRQLNKKEIRKLGLRK